MINTGFLYFDDSKHPKANFYLGTFVFLRSDMNDAIGDCLDQCGLDPENDEFKSGVHMESHPEQKALRECMKQFFSGSEIGVVVTSPNQDDFKKSVSLSLIQFIEANQLDHIEKLEIFLDEGIYKSDSDPDYEILKSSINTDRVELNIEQDSKLVRGIQLADLTSHTCSIMLKESLGLLNKQVLAGENSGYDPDTEIGIGFELWAGIRHNFFSSPPPDPNELNNQLDIVAEVGKKGLYVSNSCSEKIRKTSEQRFGSMYLGCIH